MHRFVLVPIGLLILVFAFGCATVGASHTGLGDPARMTDTRTARTPAMPPARPGDPQTIYTTAQELMSRGKTLSDSAQYEPALLAYNQALVLLLQPFDRAQNPELTRKIDALFFEACLATVRVGRLSGRFAGPAPDQKLIGIDYRPEVEQWLGYYVLTGRIGMERYLSRAHRFLPMIKAVLREEGLPEDLAYLPIIESGYSPYAYSRASAVGVWQFIASTGKNYGLTIDDWVDERRDPIKATRAAARYLKDLHKMFGDWALALAAYNCGENCVARAISSCGQKDFWKLALPGETTAYVPKFFAAALIARDPEMYGLFIQPEPPLELAQIELRGVVELKALADFLGVSYEDLKAVNPELLGTHTPPSANSYKINVPRAQADACNMKLAAVTPGQLYLDEKQVSALKKPEGSAGGTIVYRVKRGDTLSSIAKRYRTTIAAIKRQNPKVGKYLKAGMQLRIPVGKKR